MSDNNTPTNINNPNGYEENSINEEHNKEQHSNNEDSNTQGKIYRDTIEHGKGHGADYDYNHGNNDGVAEEAISAAKYGQELNLGAILSDPHIKKQFDVLKEQNYIDKINIIIIGSTGSGKSSLVNRAFNQHLQPISDTSSQTQDFDELTDTTLDAIRIYDSKGYEIGQEEEFYNSIDKFLQKRSRKQYLLFPHLCIYCIQIPKKRIEDIDHKIINLISNTYKIPIFIALTKCDQDDVQGTIEQSYREILTSKNIQNSRIFTTTENENAKQFDHLQNLMANAMLQINQLIEQKTLALNATKNYKREYKLDEAIRQFSPDDVSADISKNINVMILGKTGVGKSSLLNYVANANIVPTGTGATVTKKGEFNEYELTTNNIHLNMIDSWGLEVDKQAEWFEVINKEFRRRQESILLSDNIHAVIYVVNASTHRLEESEKVILYSLLKKVKHLIIAFSNSSYMTTEQIDYYKRELASIKSGVVKELVHDNFKGTVNLEMVFVNSVETELRTGEKLGAFGKEELLNVISEMCWYALTDFYANVMRKNLMQNNYLLKDLFFLQVKPEDVDKITNKISEQIDILLVTDSKFISSVKNKLELIKSEFQKLMISELHEHQSEHQHEINKAINTLYHTYTERIVRSYKYANSDVQIPNIRINIDEGELITKIDFDSVATSNADGFSNSGVMSGSLFIGGGVAGAIVGEIIGNLVLPGIWSLATASITALIGIFGTKYFNNQKLNGRVNALIRKNCLVYIEQYVAAYNAQVSILLDNTHNVERLATDMVEYYRKELYNRKPHVQ